MIPDEDEMTHHIFLCYDDLNLNSYSTYSHSYQPTNQPTSQPHHHHHHHHRFMTQKKHRHHLDLWNENQRRFFFVCLFFKFFFSCVKKKRFLSWLLFSRTFVCVHVCLCVCSLYINQSHVFRLKKKIVNHFFLLLLFFPSAIR